MKKIILILAFVIGTASIRAQVGSDFPVNMFASLGGGFVNYQTEMAGFQQGGYFSLSAGKWIMRPLALRIGVDWAQTHSPYQVLKGTDQTSSYFLASVQFLWDVPSTFFHVYDLPINIYPLIGLGFVTRSAIDTASGRPTASTEANGAHSDSDFQGHIGLHLSTKISKGWTVFLEGRWLFSAHGFDGKDNFFKQYMMPVMFGVTRNFYDHPYHRRTANETRNPLEDWFIGYGIGPNFSSFELKNANKLGMYGVAPELFFGRNFSNFWTIRIEATGLWAHERYDEIAEEAGKSYMFAMLHADVMLNLTHAVKYRRGVRWNWMPYLGAGPITRLDDFTFTMAADIGLHVRKYINHMGDFFVDLKYIMVPPRIGGGTGENNYILGVGYPSATVGYIHNFGLSTTRWRMPVNFVD